MRVRITIDAQVDEHNLVEVEDAVATALVKLRWLDVDMTTVEAVDEHGNAYPTAAEIMERDG